MDFIGNASTIFPDQPDATHPVGFPIMTIRDWALSEMLRHILRTGHYRFSSEAVKKSPDRSEAVAKRDWQGAKVPKSGSVASYMTRFWCFCNAASRDSGTAAVGRRFFHSLSFYFAGFSRTQSLPNRTPMLSPPRVAAKPQLRASALRGPFGVIRDIRQSRTNPSYDSFKGGQNA
uniref:Uncharacterized protein n=1 Tax=Candidatus Kentrum sp. FM TaxID=2126340 RepID=A0A450W2S6_9GAMM|nr:MAG: hypothetical protein BECKFM1743B_GA0114221_101754 [Candidatus Kentron sp. FM]